MKSWTYSNSHLCSWCQSFSQDILPEDQHTTKEEGSALCDWYVNMNGLPYQNMDTHQLHSLPDTFLCYSCYFEMQAFAGQDLHLKSNTGLGQTLSWLFLVVLLWQPYIMICKTIFSGNLMLGTTKMAGDLFLPKRRQGKIIFLLLFLQGVTDLVLLSQIGKHTWPTSKCNLFWPGKGEAKKQTKCNIYDFLPLVKYPAFCRLNCAKKYHYTQEFLDSHEQHIDETFTWPHDFRIQHFLLD